MAARRHPVDVHVGTRLKQRRTLMGLSQEKLADQVGLTFQQIQKYEKGANRITASRLFQFGRILDVPPSFFFDDMSDDVRTADVSEDHVPASTPIEGDPLNKRETLDLVRVYYQIRDPEVRKQIYELAKSVARLHSGEAED
ncbi:MAG TPA: helix-turn-helix transcriptional regulator [Candidatus Cybelea sp.]|nr:helix-turn-helix transcriptional regulator [Candidatus Cybelea sp.]